MAVEASQLSTRWCSTLRLSSSTASGLRHHQQHRSMTSQLQTGEHHAKAVKRQSWTMVEKGWEQGEETFSLPVSLSLSSSSESTLDCNLKIEVNQKTKPWCPTDSLSLLAKIHTKLPLSSIYSPSDILLSSLLHTVPSRPILSDPFAPPTHPPSQPACLPAYCFCRCCRG